MRLPSCHFLLFAVMAMLIMESAARGGAEDVLDKAVAKSGITIQLPRAWVLGETRNVRTLLVAQAPLKDKDDTGEFGAAMTISTGAATKPDAKAILNTLKHDYPHFKMLDEPQEMQINGLTGIMLGGSFQAGALKLRMRQYVLTDGKAGYVVTVIGLESAWEKYEKALEASVATFGLAEK